MLKVRYLVLTAVLAPQAAPAQVTWSLQAPAASPAARAAHEMVYDASRQLVLMFGGATGDPANPTPVGDTWEWDGQDWIERRGLSPAPSPRFYQAMAFDSARNRVVLFGGWDGATNLDDTWEWDGSQWRQVATGGPSARRAAAMAYDPVRQRVVMFGGAIGSWPSPSAVNDVWEWNGTTWIPITTTASPLPRYTSSLVFDPPSGQVLLMGGNAPGNTFYDDTWLWNGATWTQQFPIIPAPYRGYHGMVYDSARGRVVTFGGVDHVWFPRDDTREWDGLNWELRSPATRPSGRMDCRMAYDQARGRIVLFGGFDGGSYVADTWEYSEAPAASFTRFGTGCAGSAGTPQLGAAFGRLPWLGSTFSVELTSLPSGLLNVPLMLLGGSRTRWSGLPLPVDLSVIGMTGCSMFVSPTAMTTLVNQSGRATWSINLPNRPALLGASIYVQGMVVDPGANPLGITLSNAGEATVGGR